VHPSIYLPLQELILLFALLWGAVGGAVIGLVLGPLTARLGSSASEGAKYATPTKTGAARRFFRNKWAVVLIILLSVVAAERFSVGPSPPILWPAAELRGRQSPVSAVAFSPDGRSLAAAEGHTITVWDLAAVRQVRKLVARTGRISALCFAPQGNTLVSGGTEGSIRLWDLSGERQTTRLRGHKDAVIGLWFDVDGRFLFSAATAIYGLRNSEVKLWDVNAGREVAEFNWRGGPLSVAVSSDGPIVAAGNRGFTCVKLLDGETLKELASLEGHRQTVSAVTISREGEFVASAGDTGDRATEIIVWQVRRHAKYREIREAVYAVRSLAFAPDGVTLASGSGAETIRLWDVRTGELRALLRGHKYSADSIAFSPDGKFLAAGGADGIVRIWDVSGLVARKLGQLED